MKRNKLAELFEKASDWTCPRSKIASAALSPVLLPHLCTSLHLPATKRPISDCNSEPFPLKKRATEATTKPLDVIREEIKRLKEWKRLGSDTDIPQSSVQTDMSEEREEEWVQVTENERRDAPLSPDPMEKSKEQQVIVVIDGDEEDSGGEEWGTYRDISAADFSHVRRPGKQGKTLKRSAQRCSSNMRKLQKAHQLLAHQHPLIRRP